MSITYCLCALDAALLAMDFHGQKLAEDIYQVVIIAFSVVAFVAGYSQRRDAAARRSPLASPASWLRLTQPAARSG